MYSAVFFFTPRLSFGYFGYGRERKQKRGKKRNHMAGLNISHFTKCILVIVDSVTLDPENYSHRESAFFVRNSQSANRCSEPGDNCCPFAHIAV